MQDSELAILGFVIFLPAYAKQLMLATMLGFFIGLERLWRGKSASLRTFTTICVGSCIFTLLSLDPLHASSFSPDQQLANQPYHPYDLTRISAQIVSGVGFLGGGVIFKTQDRVEGITTAAMIWLTAALGMACGYNQIGLLAWGGLCFVFVYIISRVIDMVVLGENGRVPPESQ